MKDPRWKKKVFGELVEGFSAREGLIALAWECFKRLGPTKCKAVRAAMRGEGEDDSCETDGTGDWIRELAERTRGVK